MSGMLFSRSVYDNISRCPREEILQPAKEVASDCISMHTKALLTAVSISEGEVREGLLGAILLRFDMVGGSVASCRGCREKVTGVWILEPCVRNQPPKLGLIKH
jgi:hypothetical protein